MKPNDGGPAFPPLNLACEWKDGKIASLTTGGGGMSLRAWFAGQALNALETRILRVQGSEQASYAVMEDRITRGIAKAAVEIADALIAELQKPIEGAPGDPGFWPCDHIYWQAGVGDWCGWPIEALMHGGHAVVPKNATECPTCHAKRPRLELTGREAP